MNEEHDLTTPSLVRCEVTGEMVPEDETVVINGMRVSAQGKALLLEQMRAGESLPGQLEAPGGWRRLGAGVLDVLMLAVVGCCLGGIIGGTGAAFTAASGSTSAVAPLAQSLAELAANIIGVLYFAFMHGLRGQSVGKMATHIRVVRLDGSAITLGQAFARAFLYSGLGAITSLAGIFLALSGLTIDDSMAAAIVTMCLGGLVMLYWLANMICILAHPQKRAIHDLVAGTRVIMSDE